MIDLLLLSATQIILFTECERKWAFKYIERIPVPTHPSAALGTEVQDTQIDPYLGEGRPLDFSRPSGEIANALLPLLPKPKAPGLVLRKKFLMPSPSGLFAYQGELDLYAPSAAIVPGLEQSEIALVGDIKTTSNLAYAKTADDLRTDIQAQLYAMQTMFETNVDAVDLVWFYTRTRKAYRAQRSHLSIAAPHVVEQFQRIDEIGQRVRATRVANPKANELLPSPRMCEAYGGCPFRSRCNLPPPAFASAWNEPMSDPRTSSFLANLRKGATGAPADAATPATPPPAPTIAPPPVEIPPAFAKPVVPGAPLADSRAAATLPAPPPAINPPETLLPPAPPVGVSAAPVEAPKKRGRPAKNASAAPIAVDAAAIVDVDSFPKAELATFLHALADWVMS